MNFPQVRPLSSNMVYMHFKNLWSFESKKTRSNIFTPLHFYLQMLWEYKRTFAKDQKFEKAVQERFCVADLKLVIYCCDNVSKLLPSINYIKIVNCKKKIFWAPSILTW